MEIRTFGDYECLCMKDRFLFLHRLMSDGSISDVAHLSFECGFEAGGFEYIYEAPQSHIPNNLEIIPPVRLSSLKVFEDRGEFFEFIKIENVFSARAMVPFDSFAWQSNIPIRTFIESLSKQLKDVGFLNVSSREETDYGGEAASVIEFDVIVPGDQTIQNACSDARKLFSQCVDLAHIREEAFFAEFDVPEEKRYIVSQYLSYFGQFLVDFGISSNCEVAVHNASLSLSVAPKDREEAIENIHAALAAYLSLADDGELVVLPKDDGIAAVKYQQLLANVEHLRSQLRLAEALISVKDREISLLEQSLSNSRITINGKVEDKLVPTDGLAIKKYEGKFFDIDVPKLWRRITKK